MDEQKNFAYSIAETIVKKSNCLKLSGLEIAEDYKNLDQLVWLRELYLSKCTLPTLSPIGALIHLKKVSFDQVNITSGDISPLTQLTQLTDLELFNFPTVQNFNHLAKLTNLENLALARTQTKDIQFIARLRKLTHLNLAGTQVDDLNPISVLRKLESLILSNTPVKNLTPLTALKKLRYLNLTGCKDADITSVQGLPHLAIVTKPISVSIRD